MGKIFNPPKELGKTPEMPRPFNAEAYIEATNEYVNRVKAWAKKNGKGDYAGEEIGFPVADGSAVYVVLSLSPVQLIHVPIFDGYQFPFAHRLTASAIRNQIDAARRVAYILATSK